MSLLGLFLAYQALAAADFVKSGKTASLTAMFGEWPVRIFYAALGALVFALGAGIAILGVYLEWFQGR